MTGRAVRRLAARRLGCTSLGVRPAWVAICLMAFKIAGRGVRLKVGSVKAMASDKSPGN